MEGDAWEPEVALRLLVSGCRTRAELAELAHSLGVRCRPSATKIEIETEILALAILGERDRRVAEMRKLRYRRGVEQELERRNLSSFTGAALAKLVSWNPSTALSMTRC